MSPNLPCKELPTRTRRAPKHAEQSQAFLAAERKKGVKVRARLDLKSRREQQELNGGSQHPDSPTAPSPVPPSPLPSSRIGKQPMRSAGGSESPAPDRQPEHVSQTSTSRATVNASIGAGPEGPRDPILEGVLAEERDRTRQLAWFAKHYPKRDVATLDLDELVQLRRELRYGHTLPSNHDLHPNVYVERRSPCPLKRPLSQTSLEDNPWVQKKCLLAEQHGVNSSFGRLPTRAMGSAMRVGPVPKPQPQRVVQTQPARGPLLPEANQPRLMQSQPALTNAPPRPLNEGGTRRHDLANQRPGVGASQPMGALPLLAPPPPTGPPSRALAHGPSARAGASGPTSSRSHAGPRVASPPPIVARTREPPSAADYGPGVEPDDFEQVIHYVDDLLPGRPVKPRRSEWSGLTLLVLDHAADEAKARLIASGYMKSAEERELMIMLAWRHSCHYYSIPQPVPKISDRQIRYIQNLFPSCRKFMKTRLEPIVISDFGLRKGTQDEIKARVAGLLPHAFHSKPPSVPEGFPRRFEHPFISSALSAMVFQHDKDLGIKFNELFNPIPPRMLSLALAMVNDIISEHESGRRVSKATYVEALQPLFNTYLRSLSNCRRANRGNYRILLMRLHDECITSSGAMRIVEDDNNRFVLPVEAFDMDDVEPYESQYSAESLRAMLQKKRHLDCDATPPVGPVRAGKSEARNQVTNNRHYGEQGPGPSTLRNRQAAHAPVNEASREGASAVGSEGEGYGSEEVGMSDGAGTWNGDDGEEDYS